MCEPWRPWDSKETSLKNDAWRNYEKYKYQFMQGFEQSLKINVMDWLKYKGKKIQHSKMLRQFKSYASKKLWK